MRRNSPAGSELRARALTLTRLALFALLAAVPAKARAQVPEAHFADVEQRSGLLGRFVPIQPWLPHDPRRDSFYETHFANHADTHPNHPNRIKGGGLYGRHWPSYCTASFYPYFFGSPGQNKIGPGCTPPHTLLRTPMAFMQPFRPMGYYYDQGSYVPIYDLAPIVPGPGPAPYWFPFYFKNPPGG